MAENAKRTKSDLEKLPLKERFNENQILQGVNIITEKLYAKIYKIHLDVLDNIIFESLP